MLDVLPSIVWSCRDYVDHDYGRALRSSKGLEACRRCSLQPELMFHASLTRTSNRHGSEGSASYSLQAVHAVAVDDHDKIQTISILQPTAQGSLETHHLSNINQLQALHPTQEEDAVALAEVQQLMQQIGFTEQDLRAAAIRIQLVRALSRYHSTEEAKSQLPDDNAYRRFLLDQDLQEHSTRIGQLIQQHIEVMQQAAEDQQQAQQEVQQHKQQQDLKHQVQADESWQQVGWCKDVHDQEVEIVPPSQELADTYLHEQGLQQQEQHRWCRQQELLQQLQPQQETTLHAGQPLSDSAQQQQMRAHHQQQLQGLHQQQHMGALPSTAAAAPLADTVTDCHFDDQKPAAATIPNFLRPHVSYSRRPANLAGQLPEIDLDMFPDGNLPAGLPDWGPECKICYRQIHTLVWSGTVSWRTADGQKRGSFRACGHLFPPQPDGSSSGSSDTNPLYWQRYQTLPPVLNYIIDTPAKGFETGLWLQEGRQVPGASQQSSLAQGWDAAPLLLVPQSAQHNSRAAGGPGSDVESLVELMQLLRGVRKQMLAGTHLASSSVDLSAQHGLLGHTFISYNPDGPMMRVLESQLPEAAQSHWCVADEEQRTYLSWGVLRDGAQPVCIATFSWFDAATGRPDPPAGTQQIIQQAAEAAQKMKQQRSQQKKQLQQLGWMMHNKRQQISVIRQGHTRQQQQQQQPWATNHAALPPSSSSNPLELARSRYGFQPGHSGGATRPGSHAANHGRQEPLGEGVPHTAANSRYISTGNSGNDLKRNSQEDVSADSKRCRHRSRSRDRYATDQGRDRYRQRASSKKKPGRRSTSTEELKRRSSDNSKWDSRQQPSAAGRPRSSSRDRCGHVSRSRWGATQQGPSKRNPLALPSGPGHSVLTHDVDSLSLLQAVDPSRISSLTECDEWRSLAVLLAMGAVTTVRQQAGVAVLQASTAAATTQVLELAAEPEALMSAKLPLCQLEQLLPEALKPSNCSWREFCCDATRCPVLLDAGHDCVQVRPGFMWTVRRHKLLRRLSNQLLQQVRGRCGADAAVMATQVEGMMRHHVPLLTLYRQLYSSTVNFIADMLSGGSEVLVTGPCQQYALLPKAVAAAAVDKLPVYYQQPCTYVTSRDIRQDTGWVHDISKPQADGQQQQQACRQQHPLANTAADAAASALASATRTGISSPVAERQMQQQESALVEVESPSDSAASTAVTSMDVSDGTLPPPPPPHPQQQPAAAAAAAASALAPPSVQHVSRLFDVIEMQGQHHEVAQGLGRQASITSSSCSRAPPEDSAVKPAAPAGAIKIVLSRRSLVTSKMASVTTRPAAALQSGALEPKQTSPAASISAAAEAAGRKGSSKGPRPGAYQSFYKPAVSSTMCSDDNIKASAQQSLSNSQQAPAVAAQPVAAVATPAAPAVTPGWSGQGRHPQGNYPAVGAGLAAVVPPAAARMPAAAAPQQHHLNMVSAYPHNTTGLGPMQPSMSVGYPAIHAAGVFQSIAAASPATGMPAVFACIPPMTAVHAAVAAPSLVPPAIRPAIPPPAVWPAGIPPPRPPTVFPPRPPAVPPPRPPTVPPPKPPTAPAAVRPPAAPPGSPPPVRAAPRQMPARTWRPSPLISNLPAPPIPPAMPPPSSLLAVPAAGMVGYWWPHGSAPQ